MRVKDQVERIEQESHRVLKGRTGFGLGTPEGQKVLGRGFQEGGHETPVEKTVSTWSCSNQSCV